MGRGLNRLLLCPGATRREGWMRLDSDQWLVPDFLATIPPLPAAVKAVAWDEIEWVHGISSFYPWEGARLLAELHGVLAPGGKLVLEQPDFTRLLEGRRVEWFFGDPSYRRGAMMNRWAYTPDTLSAALLAAGFTAIEITKAQHHLPSRDFRLEAIA